MAAGNQIRIRLKAYDHRVLEGHADRQVGTTTDGHGGVDVGRRGRGRGPGQPVRVGGRVRTRADDRDLQVRVVGECARHDLAGRRGVGGADVDRDATGHYWSRTCWPL